MNKKDMLPSPQDHVMVQLALGANLISQSEISMMVKSASSRGDAMISILSAAREKIKKA